MANIAAGHLPVYALGDWAASYDPAVLGLGPDDAAALNDDRVGRMLDRLFDADRASLITATVLRAIREFDLDVTQLHNDSTTVTLTGAYPEADGYTRGGKATPAIRHGHNKDFRPDLKQLLLILTVCADGAVPIAYRVGDGNTPDDVTHIPTWDELRALVGPPGLPVRRGLQAVLPDAMGHIASHGRAVRHRHPARPARGHLVPGLGPDPRPGLGRGPPQPRRATGGPRPGLAHLPSPDARRSTATG